MLAELAEVDLAVAGHAHGDDLAVDLDQQVLQRRGGRDAEVRGERLDGRGVGGVQLLDGAVLRRRRRASAAKVTASVLAA